MAASTARILAQLLVNAGQVSAVTAAGVPAGDWPVYWTAEPDLPDNAVTIYNTQGSGGSGRDFITKAVESLNGFQVRVRGATEDAANEKAQSLYTYMQKSILRTGVSVGGRYYVVWSCEFFGNILDIGKESPNSRRNIVTFNAQASIKDRTS